MRILILKGQSQYDVLRFFIDEIGHGFSELGFNVSTVDLISDDWKSQLMSVINSGVDIVFSFNGMGIGLQTDNGDLLFETLKAQCISIFVDHPCIHYSRIVSAPSNSIFTFIDKSHIDFCRQHFNGKNYVFSFLPHGGSKIALAKHPELSSVMFDDSYQKASVMFSGSYKNATVDDVANQYVSPLLKSLFFSVYEELAVTHNQCFYDAVTDVMKDTGLYIANNERLTLTVNQIFAGINQVRCAENRQRLLGAAESTGINVDIYGPATWTAYCDDKKYLNYRGQKNYQEILGLYQQYQFVLNDNNDFYNGSHERHFDALVNFACPVSPINAYYQSGQHGGGVGLFYERNNPAEVIAELANAEQLYGQFKHGLESTAEDFKFMHSWKSRATELVSLLGLFGQVGR
ncbi:hypothetical protein L9G74_03950 [Shewanella sp. C32]|uniref:DUF3880 domain-containing protein n=1 Tax=Shewanella electrica TaxID=515560 RepID=A0ABT2FH61_9GAMM|nr:hypothetical protein [Shewanella electrica]MCH1923481.1 hypothetical protein [Shewanella electrica]MCS4555578.1 hypothetical protein [Shewanella electrica]